MTQTARIIARPATKGRSNEEAKYMSDCGYALDAEGGIKVKGVEMDVEPSCLWQSLQN